MQKYNCKNCGAELYWDSNAECLKCEYCDHEYQVSEFETMQEAKKDTSEPESADEYAKATDDSDSVELVVYKCSHCGAEIVTAKSTVATTCAYCGRAISMTDKLVDDFRPDVVIPFLIDEEKAREIYRDYTRKSRLTPKDFKTENIIKKMKGIFVPFWLHSFAIDSSTEVYGENTMSSRRGDDKIIHHHMYQVSLDTRGTFVNIPTDALKNLDNAMMDALEPFDYEKLEPFNPAYMAGFYAEEYGEDDKATITRATTRAQQTIDSEIFHAAGAYGIKRVQRSDSDLVNVESKYAMLPVWLLNVEYKKKDYLFAINGETGKIVGKIPMSWKKTLASIAIPPVVGYVAVFLLTLLFTLITGGAR